MELQLVPLGPQQMDLLCCVLLSGWLFLGHSSGKELTLSVYTTVTIYITVVGPAAIRATGKNRNASCTSEGATCACSAIWPHGVPPAPPRVPPAPGGLPPGSPKVPPAPGVPPALHWVPPPAWLVEPQLVPLEPQCCLFCFLFCQACFFSGNFRKRVDFEGGQ